MYYYRLFLFIFFALVLHNPRLQAQFGMAHEIGIMAGPANFLTDYGERWDIENNIKNAGFGVGLIHFMNFAYTQECNCYATDNFFTSHIRIRNEIDYLRSNLEHYGPVASKRDRGGEQLRAMHGFSEIVEIGTHIEYHPLRIRDFTYFAYQFSPYISLGIHYVSFKPDAYSDLGSLKNDENVFPSFRGGIDLEGGTTYAIAGILGARYRLGRHNDLMFEGRWHYYGSDWIDGLNIDAPQNKFNDVVFWINVGYVYYLNF